MSSLTRWRKVSSIPLSVSLSGLMIGRFLISKGSLFGLVWFMVEFELPFHSMHKLFQVIIELVNVKLFGFGYEG